MRTVHRHRTGRSTRRPTNSTTGADPPAIAERAWELVRDAEERESERHDEYDDPDQGGEAQLGTLAPTATRIWMAAGAAAQSHGPGTAGMCDVVR